eukprot:768158-Hanusia_phi.AAC.7
MNVFLPTTRDSEECRDKSVALASLSDRFMHRKLLSILLTEKVKVGMRVACGLYEDSEMAGLR